MGEITFQFVAEDELQSNLIGWFSAGHLSHVDAVIPAGLDWAPEGYLYGARADSIAGIPSGMYLRPPDYLKFSHRVTANVPATDEQLAVYWQFERKQLGKPYDYIALFAFLSNRDWREEDSWICSEEKAAAFEYSGIVRKFYLSANKITPVSFALAISAIPGTIFNTYTIPNSGIRRLWSL